MSSSKKRRPPFRPIDPRFLPRGLPQAGEQLVDGRLLGPRRREEANVDCVGMGARGWTLGTGRDRSDQMVVDRVELDLGVDDGGPLWGGHVLVDPVADGDFDFGW